MKSTIKNLASTCLALCLAGISAEADAAFVDPSVTPSGATAFTNWTRADTDTTYQQWRGPTNGGTPALLGGAENFTTLFGLNQPDNDYFNPNGIATAQYLDDARNSTGITSGFLLAGTQNAYSYFASADWEVLSPDYGNGAANTTTLILQIDVSGTELLVGPTTPNRPTAPNTVKVDGLDWSDHVELSRVGIVGGGFATFDVTHWFRFELPVNTAEHVIEFDSYDPSMGEFEDLLYGHTSIVAVAIDTLTQAGSLPGDLDSDGFVGLSDLDIILGNWNQNVPPADPRADVAGVGGIGPDGFVGLDDLDVVLGNWNAGTSPASVVPEPGAIVSLGLCVLAMLYRRR